MLARFRPASVMDLTATPDVDRLIGGLWAALSEGRCRFVMVREKCWEAIDALLP
jgi:type III restriction enzyme